MASLPGMPGSLGLAGGTGIQQPSGTPTGSDLSLDLPNPHFVAPTFNQWSTDQTPYFPIGIDAALKRVFVAEYSGSVDTLDALTFDFSFGVPGGPSIVECSLPPQGSFGQTFTILPASSDAVDDFWLVQNPHQTSPTIVEDSQLLSYSATGGSQISSSDPLLPDRGAGTIYFPGLATSYSVGGVAHLALWYMKVDTTGHTAEDYYVAHVLQIYEVSSGTPAEVATIEFPYLGDDETDVPMDASVFYDGVGALWICQVTLSSVGGVGDAAITGVTLTKLSVPGYASIGSASFPGAYGFIGDSCSRHIYLLNVDGSVSDVDPTTFVATTHYGLGADVSSGLILSHVRTSPFNTVFPFWAPMVTRAMLNPIYGASTDPVTSQFFMQGPSLSSFTRIQNFLAIDTLALFQDWGLGETVQASDPIWVPSEQAMLLSGYSGSYSWYELIYPTLDPFCAGDHGTPGGSDVNQFLPNVWIVS